MFISEASKRFVLNIAQPQLHFDVSPNTVLTASVLEASEVLVPGKLDLYGNFKMLPFLNYPSKGKRQKECVC